MIFFLLYYQEGVLRNKKTGDLSDLLPRSLSMTGMGITRNH